MSDAHRLDGGNDCARCGSAQGIRRAAADGDPAFVRMRDGVDGPVDTAVDERADSTTD